MSMELKALSLPRLIPFGTPFLSQRWERKGDGGMERANCPSHQPSLSDLWGMHSRRKRGWDQCYQCISVRSVVLVA